MVNAIYGMMERKKNTFFALGLFLAAHLQWNVVQVLLRVEVNYLHFLAMIFKNILFCANRYFPYICLDI